jgi:hypothetical protein
VFTNAYGSVAEARLGINAWMKFYNEERKHQALGYRTPRESFAASISLWICAQRKRVEHIPTGATITDRKGFHL